ncbi:tyrosine-type recombinase/integrase [Pseudomonas sp. GXZC]|uniref:tyrosine-type recombinase/integrase n=1 Tax=Pseudomonas sp. GXZC TaxID=3003351 RepID=UPI0022AB3B5B|nr:site-specific integrase [Pseudomonas sp. GXZC]WAT26305.1 site-specific integrase [Pseudomonas sp. GXZC]
MNIQIQTLTVKLSDAEIARNAKIEHVRDLRDASHPALHFRYLKNRTRGSWYLLHKRQWHLIGHFPDLSSKQVVAALPAVRLRVAADGVASVSGWVSVGELLDWFGERMAKSRALSEKRRAAIKSAISCQLKPRLNDLLLSDLNAQTLDRQLMWPAQEELSLSYVQQLFRLVATAFRQARRLDLIPVNPMAELKFSNFTSARIQPKPARLRDVQVPELVTLLAERFDSAPSDAMLALMMLCHGTRIGETRQARWADIALPEREWFLPAEHTKTKTELRVPLTDQVCGLLRRYRDRQAAQGYEGAFLFPSRRGKPLSDNQASAVFTRLGQGAWTSHDLRKVARTAWTDLGVDGHIGEMLLNHSLGKIASTYINTQAKEQRRLALVKWHHWLDARGFKAIHAQTGVRYEDSQNLVDALNGGVCEPEPQFVKGEV